MKYLIIGLGNPGAEYQNTRHNIGFKALDTLAEESGAFFMPDRYAEVASIKHKGRNLILIKPQTYMNLSGKAVRYWKDSFQVDLDKILVVTDDIALPFGTLRMKAKGSDGGHNGLKNIQETLQTSQYPRLRFGVGNDFGKGQQVNYVLGEWTTEEEKMLSERLKRTCEMIKSFTFIGIGRTMSAFNNT